ncbi:MAG: M48 family metallopeptidase, partial [Lachnospiraceae bacterium]|nr:M48 family metallopeptidase [Lachnospiraceae bacterium]
FNCLLVLLPERVMRYVVVHELCHRKEMNHSKRFWAEVAKVLPDYKTLRKQLKDEGTSLLDRL